jgi:hypothetical protein
LAEADRALGPGCAPILIPRNPDTLVTPSLRCPVLIFATNHRIRAKPK